MFKTKTTWSTSGGACGRKREPGVQSTMVGLPKEAPRAVLGKSRSLPGFAASADLEAFCSAIPLRGKSF